MSSMEALEKETGTEIKGGHYEDLSRALVKATRKLYQGERRFHERRTVHGCEIQIRKYNRSKCNWELVVPIDLSRGGTLLITQDIYNVGDLLWMMVSPDRQATQQKTFMIGGEVRHIKKEELDCHIGVKFRIDLITDIRRVNAEKALVQLDELLQVIDSEVSPAALVV